MDKEYAAEKNDGETYAARVYKKETFREVEPSPDDVPFLNEKPDMPDIASDNLLQKMDDDIYDM